jgi:hypothetical protein
MRIFWSAVVAVVAAIACLGASPQASQGAKPRVFPGVQPQLAKLGDRVFLAYGQDNVVSVLSSRDGGQTFGPVVTLAVPGRVSLGMHRGPRIAVTPNAVMVTVVAGAKGGGADGDVLLYRSADGGVTFAAPIVINDVPGSAREGLHAFAANDQGFAILAWLDLREKGTRIYSAVSRTHGVTWSADELVYATPSGSVCECCHPSIAVGSGLGGRGRAIMFRNNRDGNRDMYVVRSVDGVSYEAPEKSGTGSWKLDACPMDGGAVVLNGNDATSVWRRENDIYLATLGQPEQRLGAGRDPVIDRFDDHLDVAWSSPSGILLTRDGGPNTTLGEGRFPAIASLEKRTVVAWESQGTVKIVSRAR